MEQLIKRHPIASTAICFAIGSLPQWIAAVWSLFSNEPMVQVLEKKFRVVGMPQFSPYFITAPLGLLMFGVVVYELKKKPIVASVESARSVAELEIRFSDAALPSAAVGPLSLSRNGSSANGSASILRTSQSR